MPAAARLSARRSNQPTGARVSRQGRSTPPAVAHPRRHWPRATGGSASPAPTTEKAASQQHAGHARQPVGRQRSEARHGRPRSRQRACKAVGRHVEVAHVEKGVERRRERPDQYVDTHVEHAQRDKQAVAARKLPRQPVAANVETGPAGCPRPGWTARSALTRTGRACQQNRRRCQCRQRQGG
eukprot:1655-Chlamydomonas_euryale.AAC.2